MTFAHVQVISGILVGLLVIGGILVIVENNDTFLNIVGTISAIACVFLLFIVCLIDIAKAHGLPSNYKHIPITKILSSTLNSPEETKLPYDLSGKLVILYTFGNSKCEIIYKDLKKELKDTEVLWISSESSQGNYFLDEYPVTSIPIGVYFSENDDIIWTYSLDTSDDKGNIVLDMDSLNILLELKSEHK